MALRFAMTMLVGKRLAREIGGHEVFSNPEMSLNGGIRAGSPDSSLGR